MRTIAGLLLALGLAAAAITAVGQLDTSTSAGATNKIHWTDFSAAKIQRANLDGSNVQDLIATGLLGPALMAIDGGAGKMYWADLNAAKIQRADLAGTNVQDLVSIGLTAPFGVALDISAGKIYWTDFGAPAIQRANLDGSNVENLVTSNLGGPIGIAVGGGKIYWADSGQGKIQRANLDGSAVEDLATGLNLPGGVALDFIAGKLYWTDFGNDQIQRSNLDGSNVENLVTTGLLGPLGIALDISGGKMYWADDTADKIQRANLDGSVVEDLVTTGLTAPSGVALDVPVPPTPTPTSTSTPTKTPTITPTPTDTPTPSPFPTVKAPPAAKPTTTPNSTASGTLAIDADCEVPLGSPKDTTAEKQRTVFVGGGPFHVCVFASFPATGSASGYRVRLHWGETALDVNARTVGDNDIWHLQPVSAGGAPNGAGLTQSLGPPDDGIGSDAYILLAAVDTQDQNSSPPYAGPVAQFEFTCQAHGPANLELRLAGSSGGTVLFSGVSELKPTTSNAVIRCLDPMLDNDVDGCTNGQELGVDQLTGGLRDPDLFWDFYDVWTHPAGNPALWTKSKSVDLFGDIFGVAFRFGQTGNPTGDPLTPPLDDTGYHTAFDRLSPAPGSDPWDTQAADGTIDLFNDIFGVAFQFGHNCN